MVTLSKQELKFCINTLEINMKDLRAEAESLKLSGYGAWSNACLMQADNYERVIEKLAEAIEAGNKRIAIK